MALGYLHQTLTSKPSLSRATLHFLLLGAYIWSTPFTHFEGAGSFKRRKCLNSLFQPIVNAGCFISPLSLLWSLLFPFPFPLPSLPYPPTSSSILIFFPLLPSLSLIFLSSLVFSFLLSLPSTDMAVSPPFLTLSDPTPLPPFSPDRLLVMQYQHKIKFIESRFLLLTFGLLLSKLISCVSDVKFHPNASFWSL